MKKFLAIISSVLISTIVLAQPDNDDCADAVRLCPGVVYSGTTVDATANTTSDDNFCETPEATVWYMFTSNDAGGTVTIDFTNMVVDPTPTKGQQLKAIVYAVGSACDESTYSIYSACANGSTDFSVTTALACDPNTTYYVQVLATTLGAGVTEPGDITFDIEASGPGIDASYPTVSIAAANFDLCQGDNEPINITISDCGDTTRYDWYYDGSLILSTTEDTFSTEILPDTGDLQLIVFCDEVCNISDTSEILTFNVTPISANAGSDKFIEEGASVVIEGEGSGTPSWTPSDYLSNSGEFQPTASPPETTEYWLVVENGNCSATDNMTVHVGSVIVIYSGFTPNGDNINDKWVIGNASQFPNMEVYVYDRSGQKVFSATNYSTEDQWWDGTYKGKPLPTSAYFYVIDLNSGGSNDVYKGIVTIVR